MDAKTYPLQDILKPERRYVIPTFQRDYEWTLDGQWRLLFDDLEAAADRLLAARNHRQDGTRGTQLEQNIPPHFLGAIVCASMPFPTGGVALRSVIDGQQRLTTIQLLIRGLLDVLIEHNSEREKSVRRMLFNPSDVVESAEEVYKLWPRRRDRDVWPGAMADETPGDTHRHLYMQARTFFSSRSLQYAREATGDVSAPKLTALADALSSLFKLVVIDLDDNDDAQVIFEVLNGRQTPLSAIDLVKNLLFMRAELDNEDVEQLYDKYWAQFDDEWWKETVGRGHAARGRRDVLLSVWLTAATGNETNVGHLYREARAFLNSGPSTEEALVELNTFAQAYQVVYGKLPSADSRLVTAYQRLHALDITTAVPLLTWLATISSSQLPTDDHIRAVQSVESWAIRRTFAGWQTRGYGALLAKVLKEAKEALGAGRNVPETISLALRDNSLTWPKDEDLVQAFSSRQFYKGASQVRLRLLLGSIDQQLRSENRHEPSATVDYGSLQIEHIMPRAWVEHWPLLDENGAAPAVGGQKPMHDLLSAERDQVIDRIGNLTLVTGAFNNDVSNHGWDIKRLEFQKQKSLVLNYDVANAPLWNEEAINRRSLALAEVAIRIWGPPPSHAEE
ncbi:DUF262 domain-containing protein [Arthrobacter sp. zg-Y820]|uniref:DUF262 domain-containing protein n=1 Tax=unclassified Arthrobacter TaxID=235627 RepID=UPI001E5C117E|nr:MULTISPECIES: DUF262 domain-containing protein [unclassified Arthrobacter]MCC9195304.1 DUF262 domain-containing HNH endonuclease family protein [Arthrobacter sp. zg-Y820]MDK1278163.1 DUF262 domain-containing protein [Arthrobacter sp. zg.Y820]WIB10049.1 DUF262 domain-containing protein [Arthrobacter sp. zg-Y820]